MPNIVQTALAAILLVMAVPAVAAEAEQWKCRNTDFELACSEGKCEVSDSFTPMDINVSAEELSICAYTGCWTGEPVFVQDGPFVYASSRSLKWSHNDTTVAFQLVINRDSKLGTVLGELVGVLHCEVDPQP